MSESPFVALNVKSLLSISLADNSKVNELSSSIVWSAKADKTGASLTGITVKVKLPEPEACPSLATTLTVISPL